MPSLYFFVVRVEKESSDPFVLFPERSKVLTEVRTVKGRPVVSDPISCLGHDLLSGSNPGRESRGFTDREQS